MTKRLKLMADYDCWPLWDRDTLDNIDPSQIKLSASLAADLISWAEIYDSTLNRATGEATFASEEDERTFNETGRKLYIALKKELPDLEVSYFDLQKNALVGPSDISP